MPHLYELTIKLDNGTKKIEVVSNNEEFNTKRIERELFGKNTPKKYQVLKHRVIKENLGL